jgi:adenine-specific DNA-methyltransferase
MTKEQRPGQFYPITNPRTRKVFPANPERVWRFFPDTMAQVVADDLIIWPDEADGDMERPRFKTYYEPGKTKACSSWIENASTDPGEIEQDEQDFQIAILTSAMNQEGGRIVDDLFGTKAYPYPKPVSLIRSLSRAATRSDDLILDFFAGSGTTAHAVVELNRKDAGTRKFILVEHGNYFDTVLVPRLQRIVYSPEWKDDLAKRQPSDDEVTRTPNLMKVIRVENYDDSLHNITATETLRRESERAHAHKVKLSGDTYRLAYLVNLPLEASAAMLTLAALEHPFDYAIEVLTEDGPHAQTVDLVETFNWLYGLHVQRLETWRNPQDERKYRVVKARNRDDRRGLVLWRDMADLDLVVERKFLEVKLKDEAPFDEMLINGDAATPGFGSLDALFKQLMEEGET